MRTLLCATAIGLLTSAAAWTKEFPPGELRVCGATQCRVVTSAARTRALNAVLWGPTRVVRAPTPRRGSAFFELRFRAGPLGAVVTATSIRVHGLNCGRFERGRWYRLPKVLRRLGAGLEPRRLRAVVPPSC